MLLLIKPALSFLNLEEHLNYYFNSFSTLWEVDEGTLDFEAIEEKSYKKVLEQYKSQIREQIDNLAESQNLSVVSCNITLNEEENSLDYGMIEKIVLKVDENNSNESVKSLDIAPVVIDNVKIETEMDTKTNKNNNIDTNIIENNNIAEDNFKNSVSDEYNSSINEKKTSDLHENNNISEETSYNNSENNNKGISIKILKEKIMIYYPVNAENIDIS